MILRIICVVILCFICWIAIATAVAIGVEVGIKNAMNMIRDEYVGALFNRERKETGGDSEEERTY